MTLFGDYHTHTVYSHGKGTVLNNAEAASAAGLKQVAITDHGFSHPFYGLKKDKLPALKADCAAAEEKTGVRVLVGMESNFISSDGECDLTEEYYNDFDVFLAGAHVFAGYKDFRCFWNLTISHPRASVLGLKKEGKGRAYMTDLYVKVIEKNPVDIITHLNFRVFADAAEVARCCAKYGTYVDINTKKTHMTDEEWRAVYETGANFVIGSDAHSPDRVADIKNALSLMERVGIESSRVHNLDRLPDFRFAKFKGINLKT